MLPGKGPVVGEGVMPMRSREEYQARMRLRYVQADRAEQGGLLTEMDAATGLHRKRLIRRLARPARGT